MLDDLLLADHDLATSARIPRPLNCLAAPFPFRSVVRRTVPGGSGSSELRPRASASSGRRRAAAGRRGRPRRAASRIGLRRGAALARPLERARASTYSRRGGASRGCRDSAGPSRRAFAAHVDEHGERHTEQDNKPSSRRGSRRDPARSRRSRGRSRGRRPRPRRRPGERRAPRRGVVGAAEGWRSRAASVVEQHRTAPRGPRDVLTAVLAVAEHRQRRAGRLPRAAALVDPPSYPIDLGHGARAAGGAVAPSGSLT